MQGIFVNSGLRRPKSKKEVREQVAEDASRVFIEATSLFGNEYDGPASEMPEGKTVYFVGPDPSTSRKFYGQIKRAGDKVTVS